MFKAAPSKQMAEHISKKKSKAKSGSKKPFGGKQAPPFGKGGKPGIFGKLNQPMAEPDGDDEAEDPGAEEEME